MLEGLFDLYILRFLLLTQVTDPGWTKEETDYLFQVVREYDGRFYVVSDRYEYPNGTPRTLEVRRTLELHITCASFPNRISKIDISVYVGSLCEVDLGPVMMRARISCSLV